MTHPDTKPEALWIADIFETFSKCSHATEDGTPMNLAAAAELRRLHAECESLRHENHNLNWALGAPGYEQMFTAEEQAEADAGHARSVEIIEGMKARKARHESLLPDGRDPLDEIESLRTQLAADNQPSTDDIEYAKAQGWDVDGATAWHLIWRHADGWAGTRLMMEAWRDAAVAKAIAERDAASAAAEVQRAQEAG